MIGPGDNTPHAHLKVSRVPGDGAAAVLEVTLTLGQSFTAEHDASALDDLIETVLPTLDASFYSHDTAPHVVSGVAERFAKAALPSGIRERLRPWHSAHAGPAIVMVEASEELADLPWELLPSHFGDGLFVVRLKPPRGTRARRARINPPAVGVAAGWDGLQTGDPLPGVPAEINNLAGGFPSDQLDFGTLLNPSIEDFAEFVSTRDPAILHLSVADGFIVEATADRRSKLSLFPAVPLSTDVLPADQAYLGDKRLIAMLKGVPSLRLIFVNTMPHPVVARVPLYRRLCTQLGVAVIGWAGSIQDAIAVDFASYWYSRVLEAATVVEATQLFVAQFGLRQWVAGASPVVWVPHRDWLTDPVLDLDRTREFSKMMTQQRANVGSVAPLTIEAPELQPTPGLGADSAVPEAEPQPPTGSTTVGIDLKVRDGVFPALLTNGFKPVLSLTLASNREFNARVEIECDAGIGRSVFRLARRLVIGPNTIPTITDAEFPVLYELIATDERRMVTFTVTVFDENNAITAQSTTAKPWYSSRDWLNERGSAPFIGAYVLPMAEGVSTLVNEAQVILRQIGGPVDQFDGYPRDGEPEALRQRVRLQLQAIFQAVRILEIRYIAPPGLPVYVFNPTRMDPDEELVPTSSDKPPPVRTGQIVRMPEDVLNRRHGTCHDLSLLFAGAIEYVGLHPLVVLIPGHTFFAVWLTEAAFADYWGSDPENWEIPSETFKALVEKGDIVVVEPNLAAHPLGTFNRATAVARQYLLNNTHVIDISKSRSRVQPVRMT